MRVEPGQQCDHELVAIGRHRVCRQCAAVYAAVAGPNEVTLLGQYAAVLALVDERRDHSAASEREQRLHEIASGMAACITALNDNQAWFSRSHIALTLRDSLRTWADEYAALSETGPAGPGRGAGVEIDQLREELAETRAHEHVLVIVGDMLSRHLEWMIREPTSGLVPEVLDAIKAQSAPDVAQWLNAIHNAGFKRPGASEPAPTGPERGEGDAE